MLRNSFGGYKILGPLGKGGMGEVYRALDPQLKREVALKVMPAAFSADPDRLARFQREAEVLASLEHPNIGHIYGVAQENGDRALVLALIEGPTLADRIAQGPLPESEAVTIARQIIEALEYAHERNVVHRDLKPANIKITPEGVVKVLDFGLAKVLEGERTATSAADSPTLTMGNTQAGMILGTAAYMSPEQAVGKPADRRSDVFSFGTVLYEMLTGKRAFDGESVGEILASVVKSDPNWEPLKASPAVGTLLQRCLAKDRRQRLQAIGEARWLLDNPPTAVIAAQSNKPTHWLPWALAGLSLAALGAISFLHFGESAPVTPVLSASILPPEGAAFDFTTNSMPALSPDGSKLVFHTRGKEGSLWIRRLDTNAAQILPGTGNGTGAFWSPDGRYIAFVDGGSLKKIDTQGGPPITLCPVSAMRGGTWNRDGVILFSTNDVASVFRISAAGGAPVKATALAPEDISGNRAPVFLPDQKHFLYIAPLREDRFPLRVGSLDEPDKPGKIVAQVGSPVAYAGGRIFYVQNNTLMSQPFDADRLETTGEAVPMAENVPIFSAPTSLAPFTVSAGGLLIYQTSRGNPEALAWVDRAGKLEKEVPTSTAIIGDFHLSPDERTLVFSAFSADRGTNTNADLWLMDLARGTESRFTFDPGRDRAGRWSPDGATIYWESIRGGRRANIYRKAASGAGSDELVFEDDSDKSPHDISPDGKTLLLRIPGTGLALLPIDTPGAKPKPLVQKFNENDGKFSPDGRWVAYTSDETGPVLQIYVIPFPGPGGKHQVSLQGGRIPHWRRDGKELYYLRNNGDLMAVDVSYRNGSIEFGATKRLFGGVVTSRGVLYAPSGDGQKFLVVQSANTGSQPLTLIQNWQALLK